MADIFHTFFVSASVEAVFRAITTPEGLDQWWSLTCTGDVRPGGQYSLGFGPEYDWKARVAKLVPDQEFELEMTHSDADWDRTQVGFRLRDENGKTRVDFHHVGWPQANDHYRISCYCWAMYLRLLKKYVESGEAIPYEARLEA